MTQDNRAVKLLHSSLPDTLRAKLMYFSNGGFLSSPKIFGCDPLASNVCKSKIRCEAFMSSFSVDRIFNDAVNGDGRSFREAFKFFVDATHRLMMS